MHAQQTCTIVFKINVGVFLFRQLQYQLSNHQIYWLYGTYMIIMCVYILNFYAMRTGIFSSVYKLCLYSYCMSVFAVSLPAQPTSDCAGWKYSEILL